MFRCPVHVGVLWNPCSYFLKESEIYRSQKTEYLRAKLKRKYLRKKLELDEENHWLEMTRSSLRSLKWIVNAFHILPHVCRADQTSRRYGNGSHLIIEQINEVEQYEKMEVDDDDEISGTAEASPGMFSISRFVQESSGVVSEERGWAKNYEFEEALQKQAKEVLERHGHNIVLTNLHFASERLQTTVNYNGVLVWKIEGHQIKRQDAINGVKTALYSPYFYTSEFGYKMCAKIYMNGDGFGKGTHLSLFFVVMRGEYDALQTWPMQKKITIMLLNQGNEDHMIDAFHSDPQSSSFQRPKSDMNIAFGSPFFMPLDSLNDRQYIKDDVMFIKIIVE